MRYGCLITKEPGYAGAVFPARAVFPLLPFGQCAFVHTQESLAFDRGHFQIEPALFDFLTDMFGIGWKSA